MLKEKRNLKYVKKFRKKEKLREWEGHGEG